MQQQQDRRGSLLCRFRSLPGPIGFTLLAVPVVAAAGAFGVPALMSSPAPHTASVSAPLAAAPAPLPAAAPAARSAATAATPTTAATAAKAATVRPGAAGAAAAGHVPASAVAHRMAHPVTPAATPPATAPTEKALRAYFRAGYGYDDAVLLARLWSRGTTPYDAKLRAGGKLLHHQAVPVKPGQDAWSVSQEVALEAYADNGYGYAEAVKLAAVWQVPTGNGGIADVKVTAGRKILGGLELPVASPTAPTAAQAVQAFLHAGYGYDEAVLLSRLWAQGTTPYDAKVRAGQELLRFVQPPVNPGDTAWTVTEEAALGAYFDNGYTADDAVRLAKLWHAPTPNGELTDVKVMAGRKILAGIQLPSA